MNHQRPRRRYLIAQLAPHELNKAEYRSLIKQIDNAVADIRGELLDYMLTVGSKHLVKHGIDIVQATRTTIEVGDSQLLVQELEKRDLLSLYWTIDIKRVADDLGEDFPGLRVVKTDALQISAQKVKK